MFSNDLQTIFAGDTPFHTERKAVDASEPNDLSCTEVAGAAFAFAETSRSTDAG